MTVSQLLPKVKANRHTYYNLDKQSIEYYKKQYNYLKRHKDKEVYSSIIKEVNEVLNENNKLEYVKKVKAMLLIGTNINHTGF